MANITIFERDISVIPTQDTQTNIVYVPGYAVMGPINTPTLCTSLKQFQQIFGTKPYIFEKDQMYKDLNDYIKLDITKNASTAVYALKNTEELSYYYVTELLNRGLQVLFERVFDEEKTNGCYAEYQLNYTPAGESKFIIKAKYPGSFYKGIDFKLTQNKNSQEAIESYSLTAHLKVDTQPEALENTLTFSFDPTRDDYIGNYIEKTISVGNVWYEYTNLSIGGDEPFITLGFIGTNPVTLTENNAVLNEVTSYTNLSLPTMPEGQEVYEFNVKDIYKAFYYDGSTNESIFDRLADRNEYDLKFITSGVYATFFSNVSDATGASNIAANKKLAEKILTVACTRGDAIGLIDYLKDAFTVIAGDTNRSLQYNVNEALKEALTVSKASGKSEDARSYGTMLTPWATYGLSLSGKNIIFPGSFGYLYALGQAIQSSPNWYAVAGVTRGVVPNIRNLYSEVSGAVAKALQTDDKISINPITNIKPYGYTIWGNRTLNENKNGLVASSFLNIRSLSCDVKKAVYVAAKKFMFEPLSEILWLNFKAEIEPRLDKMVSGNGLTNYRIIRENTTKKATIAAIIRLYAVEAVENFDITIELSDSYVEVE